MPMIETAKRSQTLWLTNGTGEVVFFSSRPNIWDNWNGHMGDEELVHHIISGTLLDGVDSRQCVVSFSESHLSYPQVLTITGKKGAVKR